MTSQDALSYNFSNSQDPSPWLEVKDHIREEQKKKAYDPKKSCWVPNSDKNVGGYFEGLAEEEIKYDTFSAGKKLAINVNGEVKTYKADTVCQVIPPLSSTAPRTWPT